MENRRLPAADALSGGIAAWMAVHLHRKLTVEQSTGEKNPFAGHWDWKGVMRNFK